MRKLSMSDFNIAVDPVEESRAQKEKRFAEIHRVDGKIVARFSADNGEDYVTYEKIFADLKEFTQYTEKFLELS